MSEWQAANQFLQKLNKQMPWKEDTARQVICGKHSGIPDCCIAYFVSVWWPLTLLDARRNTVQDFNTQYLIKHTTDAAIRALCDSLSKLSGQVGYVRCPSCIISDRKVKVKRCNC